MYSIWVYTQKQGRSIGGGSLFCGGGDWSDGLREVGRLLLSRCFDGPLLGYFPVTFGFSGGRSRLGFVDGVKESPVAMSV